MTDPINELPPMEERPLVTFALFAYNQEQYIREAVEGAFAQTYEPLEIILSDDCSSDRTFEVMQEMAAAYRGPHQIRTIRNAENQGTLSHVLLRAKEARGQFMVLAAGDDISLPERSEIVFKAFVSSNPDVYALSTDDIIIDEFGKEKEWHAGRVGARDRCHRKMPTWVLGATSAYRTDFLRACPLPKEAVFYEDAVFADLIKLFGKKSLRIVTPTVKYRYHFKNISNYRADSSAPETAEAANIKRRQLIHDAKAYCVDFANAMENQTAAKSKIIRILRAEKKYLFHLSTWHQKKSVFEKFEFAYYGLRYGHAPSTVARLLGNFIFQRLKKLKTKKDY